MHERGWRAPGFTGPTTHNAWRHWRFLMPFVIVSCTTGRWSLQNGIGPLSLGQLNQYIKPVDQHILERDKTHRIPRGIRETSLA